MSLQSFTRKFEDHSTEQGFQFTFYCDFSDDGYKTKFVPSKSGKKAGFAKLIGSGVKMGGSIAGKIPGVGTPAGTTKPVIEGSELEKTTESAGDFAEELSKRFGMMSAAWHAEHDEAFATAQEEAKANFNRCSVCKRWACEYCYDDKEGVCKEHSSTMSKASATGRGSAAVSAGQVVCPACHATVPIAKFCGECGARFSMSCPNCGKQVEVGTKFCGECGARIN
jgi:hypothetical protein